ncbi:MAG: hypothetical protein JJE53_03170 [Candidatus Pacebacteria bacterium]|nr:hypothetical protein [Candidatus Paceibacterota bacterium]
MIKIIFKYFDKLEDKIRGKLTHYPILYALIGSVGIVSIWRGVWEISDSFNVSPWISLFAGIIITLTSGLFVSFFIGDNIIISGMKQEKRIDEKTEEEIRKERNVLEEIKKDIEEIKNYILINKK